MNDRLAVRKTYKLFVNGAFPRSESGRTAPVVDARGETIAWAPRASRKDVRDAVKAARAAQQKWAGSTASLRGQVLYRVAEMMEGRAVQLGEELRATGADDADREVAIAIDQWVWYAGWADKIAAIAGTVNPVAGPYFDLTTPEPVGVVGIVTPETPALAGFVACVAPALCGGNSVVAITSERAPLVALTLGEILATSDVPAGVVNILSGQKAEIGPWLAGHGDVDTIDVTGANEDLVAEMERMAADDVKRVVRHADLDESPYAVTATMELKTVWHPKGG
ncbi:MAG: aldehyde dehydrogenase family protein [Actinomycetota bacterium]